MKLRGNRAGRGYANVAIAFVEMVHRGFASCTASNGVNLKDILGNASLSNRLGGQHDSAPRRRIRFRDRARYWQRRGRAHAVLPPLWQQVFSVDFAAGADYVGDFNKLVLDRQFDVVWCSHVLEHQRNVGNFLERIYAAVKDDTGILAITVPVHPRQRLLCGHITSWNAGLLCYNLVLAGFDCSKARALQTAYELGLIVRKERAVAPEIGPSAAFHMPDQLDKLAKFFPFPVGQSANAEILDVNWGDCNYELPPAAYPGEIKITSRSSELA